jgi:hypothetical protein
MCRCIAIVINGSVVGNFSPPEGKFSEDRTGRWKREASRLFHFLIMSRSRFYGLTIRSEDEPNQAEFVSRSCLLELDGMALI